MLVILFAASASDPPSLALSAETHVGSTISFRIDEELPGNAFVPGCGPVELERLEGDRWLPVAGPPCDHPVEAQEVEISKVLTVTVPTAGTWRAVVGWGSECVAGRPFVLAACRHLDVIRSEPVVVP